MKQFIAYIVFAGLLLSTSCDPQDYASPCHNCYQDKPSEGILSVEFSYYEESPAIPVKIYIGKLEENNLYHTDTVKASAVDFWTDVGFFYTVVAEYTVDGQKILAVDGDKVDVTFDSESCAVPCWRPDDGKADCTLH